MSAGLERVISCPKQMGPRGGQRNVYERIAWTCMSPGLIVATRPIEPPPGHRQQRKIALTQECMNHYFLLPHVLYFSCVTLYKHA